MGSYHGVLLKQVTYSDTSLILTFFTREAGLISLMFKGGKRSRQRAALVPLSLWEIEASSKAGKLGYLKELVPSPSLPSVSSDMMKSSVILFLNELLVQVLQEEGEHDRLYRFIQASLVHFDREPFNPDFHLHFLLKLTEFLGFAPHLDHGQFLDLLNGETVSAQPNGPYVTGRTLEVLQAISDEKEFHLTREERQEVLNQLLLYYRAHVESMRELNSQAVLEAVFE